MTATSRQLARRQISLIAANYDQAVQIVLLYRVNDFLNPICRGRFARGTDIGAAVEREVADIGPGIRFHIAWVQQTANTVLEVVL